MTLRWGIVSCGKISNDFVNALKSLPENHKVVACAARSEESAKEFAKKHGIPNAYGDYKKLAQNKEIDIAYIGTINPAHFELSMLMLENGKGVLCEKPLTMCEQDTTRVIEKAKEKRLFFMEGLWTRFFPVYKQVNKYIQEDVLGEVVYVHATFGVPLTGVERVSVKDMGGSAILDIGIYMLQLAQYVYRGLKPIKIQSTGKINKFDTDEACTVILTYPEGKVAVLTCDATVDLPNEAVIVGRKGFVKIPQFWCPTTMITQKETLSFDLLPTKEQFNFKNSVGLAYEAEEVRDCFKKGLLESPVVTHEDSLQLAWMMDMMRTQVGVKL